MSTRYVQSEKNYRATMNYARTLGVQPFMLGLVMKDASGKRKGQYCSPKTRKTANVARKILANPDSKIEKILVNYEFMLARVENENAILNTRSKKERVCRVCNQKYQGAYEACPVCLDVYHTEFRNNFLKHMNSCNKLRILDGVK